MLFASVIASPTLFIARNNGFAISTPSSEQYFGDGIAARGAGYGVDTVRVDGNDVLAVLSATRDARRRCVESGRGVLLEAMTYRYGRSHLLFVEHFANILVWEPYSVGHHSTSDDSFAYRPRQEVEDRKRIDNPIARYRLFLQNRGWWSDAEEEELKESLKKDVMRAFKHAESMKRHELKEAFSDVYGGEEPLNLVGGPSFTPSRASSMLPQGKKIGSDTSPHVLCRKNSGRSSLDCSENTGPCGNRGRPR